MPSALQKPSKKLPNPVKKHSFYDNWESDRAKSSSNDERAALHEALNAFRPKAEKNDGDLRNHDNRPTCDKKGKSKPEKQRQMQKVQQAILVPFGPPPQNDPKYVLRKPDETRLARAGLMITATPSGEELEFFKDATQEEMFDTMAKWFPKASEYLMGELVRVKQDHIFDWFLPAKKRYREVTMIGQTEEWNGATAIKTFPATRKTTGVFIGVSALPIPDKILRSWKVANANKPYVPKKRLPQTGYQSSATTSAVASVTKAGVSEEGEDGEEEDGGDLSETLSEVESGDDDDEKEEDDLEDDVLEVLRARHKRAGVRSTLSSPQSHCSLNVNEDPEVEVTPILAPKPRQRQRQPKVEDIVDLSRNSDSDNEVSPHAPPRSTNTRAGLVNEPQPLASSSSLRRSQRTTNRGTKRYRSVSPGAVLAGPNYPSDDGNQPEWFKKFRYD